MATFSPLDLSRFYNTGRENPAGWPDTFRGLLAALPAGVHACWGIPFCFGPEGTAPALLSLGESAVAVPAGGMATHVVFAHFSACPGHPWGAGASLGETLAEYVLVYADGSEHRQPIRGRFEIQNATVGWGNLPFAARPHGGQAPVDPKGQTGPGAWGYAQTAVADRDPLGWHGTYWLYALENPHPEREIAGVRLRAAGAVPVGVGAITLFTGEEHPLRHRRLEAFRVALAEAAAPDAAGIGLDLGVLGRVYAVPAFDPEAWLDAAVAGWGEESVAGAPAELIAELASTLDATLSVQGRDVPLGPAHRDGRAASADGAVRVELLTPRKTWVHVEVVDASTGRPTPSRIHFRAPDGRYLPPYGHRHEVNDNWFEDYGADLKLGATQYAYVDGRFQVELPVGDVYVEVAKGFEYRPVRRRLAVAPGQGALRLDLERPLDLRRLGWVTADTHVHFITPQTAWLEAQGEGVNLVNLLASQWGDLFTNFGDLSGGASGVSRDDTLVWVGTENRQHMLGHMSLLGGKGDPVTPMCAGGPSESYLGDPVWMALAEWAEECRKRDGLVVIPHFPNPYCEVAADIVLGRVDAAEIRTFTPDMASANIAEWYRALNCGYRVPAVGGTDKMSAGMPVGGVRTYAHLGDAEFTFENWARAVRAGRTFTTSGPLLHLSVEGKVPGEEVRLPEGGGTVAVDASAESMHPFHALQIVVNGVVAHQEEYAEGTRQARLQVPLRMDGPAWMAARCVSRHKVWHCWPIQIAAHTSPVYLPAGGRAVFRPDDARFLLTVMEGGLTWLDTLATPAGPERHAAIRRLFTEAHGRLHKRMHEV